MKKLSLVLSLLWMSYLSHASNGRNEDERDDEISQKIRQAGIQKSTSYRGQKVFFYTLLQKPSAEEYDSTIPRYDYDQSPKPFRKDANKLRKKPHYTQYSNISLYKEQHRAFLIKKYRKRGLPPYSNVSYNGSHEISEKYIDHRPSRSVHESPYNLTLNENFKKDKDVYRQKSNRDLDNDRPKETPEEYTRRREGYKKEKKAREYAQRIGVPNESLIPKNDLRAAISQQQKLNLVIKQSKLEQKTDELILRANNRRPGERVSYQDRLEERHAFTRRGDYDAGLCRHSDDLLNESMKSSHTRSYNDIVEEAKKRQNSKGR